MPNRGFISKGGGLILRYLILGSSAAAIAAVETLLWKCPKDEIIMVSADEVIHSRCMLHHYLAYERDAESLNFVKRNFLKQDNLKCMMNTRALSVDTHEQVVNFENINITYDKLLIATGTNNFIPDIEGLKTAPNVYTLGNLKDATVIRSALKEAQSVVVIGSGLIGMDITQGIIQSGVSVSVHVIEAESHIIPKQLDANIASNFQKAFEKEGVKFHLGKKVMAVELDKDKIITALKLDCGSIIPCDMIIVAAGTRPNICFLENSDIEIDNGIKIDNYLQTSNEHIYAAGDVTGIAANWYAAVKQGRIAGNNMAGNKKIEYTDEFHMTNTINLCKMAVASIGKVNPPFDDFDVFDRVSNGKYLKLVIKDGLVKGALLFGDISHAGHWKYIIENAVPIDSINKSPLSIEYADFFEIDTYTAEFKYNLNY